MGAVFSHMNSDNLLLCLAERDSKEDGSPWLYIPLFLLHSSGFYFDKQLLVPVWFSGSFEFVFFFCLLCDGQVSLFSSLREKLHVCGPG